MCSSQGTGSDHTLPFQVCKAMLFARLMTTRHLLSSAILYLSVNDHRNQLFLGSAGAPLACTFTTRASLGIHRVKQASRVKREAGFPTGALLKEQNEV